MESEFPGVFRLATDADTGMAFCQSGLRCPNPECRRPDNWGESDPWSCISKILNKMNLVKKQKQKLYYDGLLRCNDPMCNLQTRQLSVYEGCCLKPGCNGPRIVHCVGCIRKIPPLGHDLPKLVHSLRLRF